MTTKGLYFDGTKKQYAYFDGSEQDLPARCTDCTLEFWIRAPVWSGGENYQSIIEFGEHNNSGSRFGVYLTVQEEVTYLDFWGNAPGTTPLQVGVPDDQWHFMAFTYSGNNGDLGVYLDGEHQRIFSIDTGLNTSVGTCYIGGFPPHNWYFTGSVSGIKVWKVVRTALQIRNDMTDPRTSSTGDLVASIPLDEERGTTFAVRGAGDTIITTGTITNNPLWNQPVAVDPDRISEGIWFVIQNKAGLEYDFAIPADRLALTVGDDTGLLVMDVIPLKGNYDRFLWRAEHKEGRSYLLVNKQGKDTVWLDLDTDSRLITSNGQDADRKWSLTPARQDDWGTNVYFLEDRSAADPKRITYTNAKEVVLSATNDDDADQQKKQAWLLQPMEVRMGYYISAPPAEEKVAPFTKKLESEFGVTCYATISTSEWAILTAHLIIRNVINAIQPIPYNPSKAFAGWKVLIISNYDSVAETVHQYPMIEPLAHEQMKSGTCTVADYWGGTHPEYQTVLVTESMMSHTGVPYRRNDPNTGKPDTTYREFEQVVHEFGHVINDTILSHPAEDQLAKEQTDIDDPILGHLTKDQLAKEQTEAKENWQGQEWEWFPWQVQYWLNSAQSEGMDHNRSHLSKFATIYLGTIFKVSNTWLPPRWLRDHQAERFELPSGASLTGEQILFSPNRSRELCIQNGNLIVSDDSVVVWDLKGALHLSSLGPIQSVEMTNGQLHVLDYSGGSWTSPNEATPDARLVVYDTDTASSGVYFRIIGTGNNTLWQGRW